MPVSWAVPRAIATPTPQMRLALATYFVATNEEMSFQNQTKAAKRGSGQEKNGLYVPNVRYCGPTNGDCTTTVYKNTQIVVQ